MTGKGGFQYELKLVNGLQGDPAVYFFFPVTGQALLFDLGVIDNLSNREVLKVRNVYVSHTHIDHFIGFDRLLRVNIPHGRKLHLCGPTGFIANVVAKIKGYTWNLLDPGQLQFEVREVHRDGTMLAANVTNDNGFEPIYREPLRVADGPIQVETFDDGGWVETMAMDHGTDSAAYCYHAPRRFHVDAEAIAKRGWQPGPWISELQTAMNYQQDDVFIPIAGRQMRASDLAGEILKEAPPFAIAYLTDIRFDRKNFFRIRQLMQGARLLICESNFRDQEWDRALDKKHLTTRQAALIAAAIGAKNLQVFHISSIYGKDADAAVAEAVQFFADFSKFSEDKLNEVVEQEFQRLGL